MKTGQKSAVLRRWWLLSDSAPHLDIVDEGSVLELVVGRRRCSNLVLRLRVAVVEVAHCLHGLGAVHRRVLVGVVRGILRFEVLIVLVGRGLGHECPRVHRSVVGLVGTLA